MAQPGADPGARVPGVAPLDRQLRPLAARSLSRTGGDLGATAGGAATRRAPTPSEHRHGFPSKRQLGMRRGWGPPQSAQGPGHPTPDASEFSLLTALHSPAGGVGQERVSLSVSFVPKHRGVLTLFAQASIICSVYGYAVFHACPLVFPKQEREKSLPPLEKCYCEPCIDVRTNAPSCRRVHARHRRRRPWRKRLGGRRSSSPAKLFGAVACVTILQPRMVGGRVAGHPTEPAGRALSWRDISWWRVVQAWAAEDSATRSGERRRLQRNRPQGRAAALNGVSGQT